MLQHPGLPFTDATALAAGVVTRKSATFNDDGSCRMTLSRFWGEGPHALICGANPSTADADSDDPTSLAWTHFCRLWGFAGYVAVNPIPVRSSTPDKARQWWLSRNFGNPSVDAIMAVNIETIRQEARKASLHIVSWGNLIDDPALLKRVIEAIAAPLYCFGTTKDGRPKHVMARGPHRVPRDQQPILWRAA
jgi:hypothetical protein